jgi:uncharacterized protein YjbJ (UPF0337 family)
MPPVGYRQERAEPMNWDQIESEWQQIKSKFRTQWGKLTDDDLEVARGKKDALLAALKNRYGYEKDRALKDVDAFIATIDAPSDRKGPIPPARDSHP